MITPPQAFEHQHPAIMLSPCRKLPTILSPLVVPSSTSSTVLDICSKLRPPTLRVLLRWHLFVSQSVASLRRNVELVGDRVRRKTLSRSDLCEIGRRDLSRFCTRRTMMRQRGDRSG